MKTIPENCDESDEVEATIDDLVDTFFPRAENEEHVEIEIHESTQAAEADRKDIIEIETGANDDQIGALLVESHDDHVILEIHGNSDEEVESETNKNFITIFLLALLVFGTLLITFLMAIMQ